jgi:aquaporin Z
LYFVTIASHRPDELYPGVLVETPRILVTYAVEALGTFGLVVTVGVALSSRSPILALGIGAVLMAWIFAAGHRAGAHFNPAITLAAALWGRIPLGEATAIWLAQLAAGFCAAIATRLIVGYGQSDAATGLLDGRALLAAYGASLLFVFVLTYVVCSCAESPRNAPNTLWHLTIGIAVVAGAVDFAALFGDGYLVSQVIVGAFTGIAFLTFGSAAP